MHTTRALSPIDAADDGSLLMSPSQMMAMTANLASPGVSETYRTVARAFRWCVCVCRVLLSNGAPCGRTRPAPVGRY